MAFFSLVIFWRSFEILSVVFFVLQSISKLSMFSKKAKFISCLASEDPSLTKPNQCLELQIENLHCWSINQLLVLKFEAYVWEDVSDDYYKFTLSIHTENRAFYFVHAVSYLHWLAAVVTLATRCFSAERVAVGKGAGDLWGWRWQRRWWWPGRRKGCYWTEGPPLRSGWILARWLAWRRWAVGL